MLYDIIAGKFTRCDIHLLLEDQALVKRNGSLGECSFVTEKTLLQYTTVLDVRGGKGDMSVAFFD